MSLTTRPTLTLRRARPSFGMTAARTRTPRPLPLYTRHDHGGFKHLWTLTPTRSKIIMGDSNLHRLPAIGSPHIQVDCYPGAKFCHAANILSSIRAPVGHVTRVILAFGLNNRSTPLDLTTRQIRDLYSRATTAFPSALILIPLINPNPTLSRTERDTIRSINGYLAMQVPTIPLLPSHLFQTDPDRIHWTTHTAGAIFNHWSPFLN